MTVWKPEKASIGAIVVLAGFVQKRCRVVNGNIVVFTDHLTNTLQQRMGNRRNIVAFVFYRPVKSVVESLQPAPKSHVVRGNCFLFIVFVVSFHVDPPASRP